METRRGKAIRPRRTELGQGAHRIASSNGDFGDAQGKIPYLRANSPSTPPQPTTSGQKPGRERETESGTVPAEIREKVVFLQQVVAEVVVERARKLLRVSGEENQAEGEEEEPPGDEEERRRGLPGRGEETRRSDGILRQEQRKDPENHPNEPLQEDQENPELESKEGAVPGGPFVRHVEVGRLATPGPANNWDNAVLFLLLPDIKAAVAESHGDVEEDRAEIKVR